MIKKCVALLVAITPSLAVAEPEPITIVVGPSFRANITDPDNPEGEREVDRGTASGALMATVAHRVTPHFALGLYASVSWRRSTALHSATKDNTTYVYDAVPIDLAVVGHFEPGRLFGRDTWIAPRLGWRLTRLAGTREFCKDTSSGVMCSEPTALESTWSDDQLIMGTTAGIDLASAGRNRLAAFLDAQFGTGDAMAIGVGLALHR